MTGESEMFEALPKTFWTALLLTGSIEAAEAAVLDGIAALEWDYVSGDSLLQATAKSAIQRRSEFPEQSERLSILPLELRRLFQLAPNYRDCFVLRVLIGLTPEFCSGILHLSIHEVEDALYTALQELPRIETCDMDRGEIHPAQDAKGGLSDFILRSKRMVTNARSAIPVDSSGARSELIGSSPGLRKVWDALHMVARTDSAVLIHGETGTGKELAAKAIHEESFRKCGPYVKLNCAAIPSGLLESELFGHERGAFTGALTQTTGRFQRAHTGTLFLDEIGDLPLELQPKLLRVLQEQEFERLGGNRTIRVDVRIVAATNQNLYQMVRERRFRADLFYRLNVFPITLPPLRERSEDIPLLVQHFVRKCASRMNKEFCQISEGAMGFLQQHDWPGNIRELQNLVERAVIMSSGPNLEIPFGELNSMIKGDIVKGDTPTPIRTLAEAQRDHILEALRQSGGVVAGRNGAAVRLGLARTTLLYRMRKLGIAQERAVRVGNAAGWAGLGNLDCVTCPSQNSI